MKNKFALLVLSCLFLATEVKASVARTIDADAVISSDHVYTHAIPTTGTNLVSDVFIEPVQFGSIMASPATDVVPMTLNEILGATSDFIDIVNSSSVDLFKIDYLGNTTVGGGATHAPLFPFDGPGLYVSESANDTSGLQVHVENGERVDLELACYGPTPGCWVGVDTATAPFLIYAGDQNAVYFQPNNQMQVYGENGLAGGGPLVNTSSALSIFTAASGSSQAYSLVGAHSADSGVFYSIDVTGFASFNGEALSAALTMNNNQINNVADPTSAQDAATKHYIDNLIIGPSNGGTGAATTPSNGQLLIGNGSDYTVASLSSGTGNVSYIVGSGSLSISVAVGANQNQDVFYGNSSVVAFTLAATPAANAAVTCYEDGALQQQGSGYDYTVSSAIVTESVAPATGQKLICTYNKY